MESIFAEPHCTVSRSTVLAQKPAHASMSYYGSLGGNRQSTLKCISLKSQRALATSSGLKEVLPSAFVGILNDSLLGNTIRGLMSIDCSSWPIVWTARHFDLFPERLCGFWPVQPAEGLAVVTLSPIASSLMQILLLAVGLSEVDRRRRSGSVDVPELRAQSRVEGSWHSSF